MKIQILGTGCPKCRQLEANARVALVSTSLDASVEKVTDLDEIMNMGAMMTPALAIDGVIKKAGKVPGKDEITRILQGGE